MEKKVVGIVGAGIGGLLACKYALSKGYHPLVFESQGTIGGVWAQTMETTKLQSPKPLYQFSDFPWPSYVEELFPHRDQVFDYILSYAKHFDLLRHIKFHTKVISINYVGSTNYEEMRSWCPWGDHSEPFGNKAGKWVLTVQDLCGQLSSEVVEVDFVILCVGRFSEVPNMPEFPAGRGPEALSDNVKVMHSVEFSGLDYKTATSLIKGKRVTVVGYGKTALDIALECSMVNGVDNPCTVICRTPHWNIPDFFLWRFPLRYLYLNRFAELWVHKPGDGAVHTALATFLSPLKWAICKVVERNIKQRHRLEKFNVLPEQSFLKEMNACLISTVPEGFYDNVQKGSIILKRCSSFSFYNEGIQLNISSNNNVEVIKSDLVIFATGFKGDLKLKNIFASHKFKDYIMSSTQIAPLYRDCIHPRIPQLAIIGFSDNSLSNLYTSEMKCRWLSELLDGKFKLPSIEEMENDISTWNNLVRKYSSDHHTKTCIGALHIWYNDQLCKDMGWNPKRKKGFWAELFEPYGPTDYAHP